MFLKFAAKIQQQTPKLRESVRKNCKKMQILLFFIDFHEFFGFFGEFVSERLGCEDFEIGSVGSELLDEVERGCEIPFEDQRFGLLLGGMERKRTEIFGICFFLHTYADDFRLEVLAAEGAVGRCEKLSRVEVLGSRESAFEQFEALDTVERVHLGASLVECAIQFVTDTKDVPALFEHFETERREIEGVRIFGIEALVGTEEHATFADSGDDGGKVLCARRDELVDDVFTHFAAGFERLT